MGEQRKGLRGPSGCLIGCLLLALILLGGCAVVSVFGAKRPENTAPCPSSTASTLAGSAKEGFNDGLSGCR